MYCVALLIIARFGALQYENDSLSHYRVVGIQRAGGYLRSRHLPHREAQLGRIDNFKIENGFRKRPRGPQPTT